MKRLLGMLLVAATVAALAGGCYLHRGGGLMLSPRYDESRLLGLTRAQVVQRLGPPSYDPQASATRPWNQAEDGPYYLGYYQGAATCSITFAGDKVASVRRYWK